MNKHSIIFNEKKSKLLKEEEELKKALEAESESVENSIVEFAKWLAISGLIAGIFYGIYKLVSGKKETDISLEKGGKKEKKPENPFVKNLTEKLTDQIAVTVTGFLSNYLSKLQESAKKRS